MIPPSRFWRFEAMPSLSDYMRTMQNPGLFLSDRELAACTCPKDSQGQPVVESGGFALMFPLNGPTGKWAVRCFHRDVADRGRRYSAISRKLNEQGVRDSGYFVGFFYDPKGITVGGERFPIVKMAWAQGETMGRFLQKNYRSLERLANLREALRGLSEFLTKEGIAHGDIQPGNVMVSDNGRRVQLIDYDGLFVPGMESLGASETGVPNFQHPKRASASPWDATLDRFSFIMLDVALSLLESDPSLWKSTDSSDEKVLFDAADFAKPGASKLFKRLRANPSFKTRIAALQRICRADFSALPSLTDYMKFRVPRSAAKGRTKQSPKSNVERVRQFLAARDGNAAEPAARKPATAKRKAADSGSNVERLKRLIPSGSPAQSSGSASNAASHVWLKIVQAGKIIAIIRNSRLFIPCLLGSGLLFFWVLM